MATGDKLVTFDMAKAMNDDLNGKAADLKSAIELSEQEMPPFKIEKANTADKIRLSTINDQQTGLSFKAVVFKGTYRLIDALGHLIDEFTTDSSKSYEYCQLQYEIAGPDYNTIGDLYWDTSKDGINKIGWANRGRTKIVDADKTRYPIGYYDPYTDGAGLVLNLAYDGNIKYHGPFHIERRDQADMISISSSGTITFRGMYDLVDNMGHVLDTGTTGGTTTDNVYDYVSTAISLPSVTPYSGSKQNDKNYCHYLIAWDVSKNIAGSTGGTMKNKLDFVKAVNQYTQYAVGWVDLQSKTVHLYGDVAST